ncbi:MAG: peptidase M48, partial [Deltaproteobacteria bacterium]|nr:peptidase M48 [Deltaproteobacteria bacterium]
MVIYFRYVMGFFMRNFERQADLYSSVIMESPGATVSSLEKVAYFSGKTRDLPSWHHFSIRERIDFLMKTRENPGLIRRHNRFV